MPLEEVEDDDNKAVCVEDRPLDDTTPDELDVKLTVDDDNVEANVIPVFCVVDDN